VDFDGDGKTDIAVWRKDTGYSYVQLSSDPGGTGIVKQFGLRSLGTVPVNDVPIKSWFQP